MPASPDSHSPPSPPPRGFWRRRVLDPVIAQITQGATPDKIALTLGIGVAGGMFPFLGFTTILCTAAAFVLKLNQPVIQIVNQLLWPLQLPGMFAYAWLATRIFPLTPVPLDPQKIKHLLFHDPAAFFQQFGWLGLGMFAVWLMSAPLLIAGIYYPVRPALRKLAALRQPKAATS